MLEPPRSCLPGSVETQRKTLAGAVAQRNPVPQLAPDNILTTILMAEDGKDDSLYRCLEQTIVRLNAPTREILRAKICLLRRLRSAYRSRQRQDDILAELCGNSQLLGEQSKARLQAFRAQLSRRQSVESTNWPRLVRTKSLDHGTIATALFPVNVWLEVSEAEQTVRLHVCTRLSELRNSAAGPVNGWRAGIHKEESVEVAPRVLKEMQPLLRGPGIVDMSHNQKMISARRLNWNYAVHADTEVGRQLPAVAHDYYRTSQSRLTGSLIALGVLGSATATLAAAWINTGTQIRASENRPPAGAASTKDSLMLRQTINHGFIEQSNGGKLVAE